MLHSNMVAFTNALLGAELKKFDVFPEHIQSVLVTVKYSYQPNSLQSSGVKTSLTSCDYGDGCDCEEIDVIFLTESVPANHKVSQLSLLK